MGMTSLSVWSGILRTGTGGSQDVGDRVPEDLPWTPQGAVILEDQA